MNVNDLEISRMLKQGVLIETILLQGQKGRFYSHLAFFLQFMSVFKAITCGLKMTEFEDKMYKILYSKLTYPCFILFLSIASIYMFSHTLIPMLLSSFQEESNLKFVAFLSFIEWIGIAIIYILILFALFYLSYSFIYSFKKLFYKKIAKHISIVRVYISYLLSGYLQELNAYGLSSYQSLSFLAKLNKNSILSFLIIDLNQELLKGVSFLDVVEQCPYLDTSFKTYFKIGYHNSALRRNLHSYTLSVEAKAERFLSLFAIAVQIISYSFVGILLLCVYQIMLIPLNVLEKL